MKTIFLIPFLLILCHSSWSQTENYWVQKANFGGMKRERAVSFTALGFGFVATGIDTNEVVKNDLWSYDPVQDTWTQKANMPGVPRRNAVAFSINDKGYVGCGYSQAESILGVELADFWEYNPATNTWTQKASYPYAHYFSTGFSIGNKGYVCGGKRGPNWYVSDLYEYDPSLDSWTAKASFPGGVRYQLSSFVINNSGYVGLGTDQDMYRKDFWEYKPSLDQWSQKADLPGSERASSHTFAIGNRGFVCTGTNGGVLDDFWEFNPFTNEWNVRATYGGSKRKGGIGFAIDGRGYVGTGKGNNGKKETFYQYIPGSWVGLEENEAVAIHIYPNPASSSIQLYSPEHTLSRIDICNAQGQTVASYQSSGQLDISQLSPGMYYVMAKNDHGNIIGNEQLIVH